VSGLARHVRFALRSRYRQPAPACPFGAKSGGHDADGARQSELEVTRLRTGLSREPYSETLYQERDTAEIHLKTIATAKLTQRLRPRLSSPAEVNEFVEIILEASGRNDF
jgi:hypothetical protein